MRNKKAVDSLCTIIGNWKLDACVMKMILEDSRADDSEAFGISVLLHKEFKRIVQNKLYLPENLENELLETTGKCTCVFEIVGKFGTDNE